MIRVNPESINDLLALKHAGIPVTLTSHPGNASLYKLTMWKCGIPEHLWDVTCCKADTNNWPMHRLVNGTAELLISKDLHKQILQKTHPNHRFVTAYQKTTTSERLGRVHVKAMQSCFPNVISSTSHLLLSEKEKILEVFDYLAHTKRDEVFGRFITSDGVMRAMHRNDATPRSLATSFVGLLEELDHLLFSDEPIITKGGACYDGIMVPLSCMLVQYWQTGRMDRYDISGPDMIHYATRIEHQEKLSDMLAHLHKWNPKLIPEHIMIHMFPGTLARVGHVAGHISEEVMRRKKHMLENAQSMDRTRKEKMWALAKEDRKHWPTQIKPSVDRYFSQHDLVLMEKEFVVDEFWKNVSIRGMHETLQRANNLLRI